MDLKKGIIGSDTAQGGIIIHNNKMLFVKSAIGDYYMKMIDDDLSLCKTMTDEGEELVWLTLEEIKKSKIKPDFIKEQINEIISENKTIHVIEERER